MIKASPAERITEDQISKILSLYTTEELAETLGPVWDRRLREIGIDELTALGVPGRFDNLNPFFAQHVNEFALDRLVIPIGTSHDIAAEQIALGVDKLESIDQIAQRLIKVGATDQQWRARLIARTETTRSANVGRAATWKASGLPGLKKRWLSGFRPTSRKSHMALHNAIVGLDEKFVFDGTLEPGIGAEVSVPGDSGHASHDCNCVCSATAFDPEHGKAIEFGSAEHVHIIKSRQDVILDWEKEAIPLISNYYADIERKTLEILGL